MTKYKIYSVVVIAALSVFAMPVSSAHAVAAAGGCVNPGLSVAECSQAALRAYCKSVRLNAKLCCTRKSRRTGQANHVERYTCRSANPQAAVVSTIDASEVGDVLGISLELKQD